ncbi:MAG: N-acetyl-gamma-glutamyl-phosphate reductase [Rickettsiales bacterium]|nr:N-acetyl-gamma-glutamyl-phosphate reductase [Rickettsiales bacterium]
MKHIQAAIIGASGYTGAELVRILLNHDQVEISALVANNNAGLEIGEIYSHLQNFNLPLLKKIEEIDFSNIDVAFGCLPHATSQEIFNELNGKYPELVIIDLSADFRLTDPANYKLWYGSDHKALKLQEKAVYGLSEINRNQIKNAKIIACPGCYPTSVLLPLIPLLENSLINKDNIIIDSKSGASGAGRSLKQSNLFCEISNSFKAYSVGSHRHMGEIEQELGKAASEDVTIEFTPHLLPINRGIVSTIYVDIKEGLSVLDIENCLKTKYEDEYFVNYQNKEPALNEVVNTNFCLISAKQGRNKNKAIIISALDNLCKGASGQAVQNMNLIFGFDEFTGLKLNPLFP